MDDLTAGNIELSAILDLYTYLDDAVVDRGYEGNNLSFILEDLNSRVQNHDNTLSQDQRDCISIMYQAVQQNPEWGGIELVERSSIDADRSNPTVRWTDDSIQAATFKFNDDYYLAFRGTGDGRWTDDAIGMTEISPMQQDAIDYYDELVERLHLDQIDGNIYLGGHSKGADEIIMIALLSEHSDLIDGVYPVDGEGVPPIAIQTSIDKWTSQGYMDRLALLIGVNGEYDPVHQMGIVVTPDGNTYYLPVNTPTSGFGLLHWHDIKYMFAYQRSDGSFVYTGLDWQKDQNGNYLNGTPSYVVEFASGLSDKLMALDPDTRDSVARTAMYLIDMASGLYLSDPSKVPNARDIMDFIFFGVPIIGFEMLFTPEGNKTLVDLVAVLHKSMVEKFGDKVGTIVTSLILTGVVVIGVPLLLTCALLGKLFENKLIYNAFLLSCAALAISATIIYDICKPFFDVCELVINAFVSYIHKHSYSYQYVQNNPCISVDPYQLEGYAETLNTLNRRLEQIESSIKSLYSAADDPVDLYWIQRADMKVGFSQKLRKCKEYLETTAAGFCEAETNIDRVLMDL